MKSVLWMGHYFDLFIAQIVVCWRKYLNRPDEE